MMQTHLSQLQSALYALLDNDAELHAIIHGIYDAAPENPVFPYITLSDIQIEDASARSLPISEIHFELNIWSTYQGRAELYNISENLDGLITNTGLQGFGAHQLLVIQKQKQRFFQLSKQRVMQSNIHYRAIMQGDA